MASGQNGINFNPHFHFIAIDGVYTVDDEGDPIFHRIPGILNDEISRVIKGVSTRVIKYLRKIGKLPEEGEEMMIAPDHCEHLALSTIKRASISSHIALGPRAGGKVRRIGSSFGYEEEIAKVTAYGCASMNGFSLHAATQVKAHERDRLAELLRYVGRGPVSNERFSLDDDGNILYRLKNSYDGSSHILLSPLELLEKLAAIIPPARKHQVTYYGCLSSHHKLRPLIIPSQAVVEEASVSEQGQNLIVD